MPVHQGIINDASSPEQNINTTACLLECLFVELAHLHSVTVFAFLSLRRDLDPRLQAALREYLVARGFNSKLASSILQHLLQKERNQYVNWLKTLEEAFAKHH
jgi:hypothetical protein